MAKYDKSKDVILRDYTIPDTSIHIQLVRYDKGEEKITIVNEIPIKKDGKFIMGFTSKMGRFPISVAHKISESLQIFLDDIQKSDQ